MRERVTLQRHSSFNSTVSCLTMTSAAEVEERKLNAAVSLKFKPSQPFPVLTRPSSRHGNQLPLSRRCGSNAGSNPTKAKSESPTLRAFVTPQTPMMSSTRTRGRNRSSLGSASVCSIRDRSIDSFSDDNSLSGMSTTSSPLITPNYMTRNQIPATHLIPRSPPRRTPPARAVSSASLSPSSTISSSPFMKRIPKSATAGGNQVCEDREGIALSTTKYPNAETQLTKVSA